MEKFFENETTLRVISRFKNSIDGLTCETEFERRC